MKPYIGRLIMNLIQLHKRYMKQVRKYYINTIHKWQSSDD